MRHTTRQRGVTLHRIDTKAWCETAAAFLAERDKLAPATGVRTGYDLAWAEHGGVVYLICSEGVGWPVDPDDGVEVEFYRNAFRRDDDTTAFDIFPSATLRVSPDEVKAASSGEDVDLADFVRTFGDRLESNYWLWLRTLTTAVGRAEDEPCERGTVGCSVHHTGDTPCETW